MKWAFNLTAMLALLIQLLLLNEALGEWIDIPQFSNGNKVYRIPTEKQDYFHKFVQKNMGSQFYPYQNITFENAIAEQTAVYKNVQNDCCDKDNIKKSIVLEHNYNVALTDKTEYDKSLPVPIEKDEEIKYTLNDSSKSKNIELLEYLPMDMLKSVHHTLISQSTSNEGKIQFLQTFENSLINEIDSRLADTVKSRRDKRGTDHYDHSYDNEHAAGFPSIEGALMAISFLTFAVYLIRLVMLLFRNMNNNNMSPTTGATLFVGRRKKSVNNFDEDVAMILERIQSFSSKL